MQVQNQIASRQRCGDKIQCLDRGDNAVPAVLCAQRYLVDTAGDIDRLENENRLFRCQLGNVNGLVDARHRKKINVGILQDVDCLRYSVTVGVGLDNGAELRRRFAETLEITNVAEQRPGVNVGLQVGSYQMPGAVNSHFTISP